MFNNVRIIKVLSFILLLFILFHVVNIWWSYQWQQAIAPSPEQFKKLTVPAKELPTVTVQSIALPQLPKPTSMKKLLTHASKPDVFNSNIDKNKAKVPKPKLSDSNTKLPVASTEKMYNQLVDDKSLSIELAWPNHSLAREKMFRYLYQCVGMKFAVLDKTKLTVLMGSSHALHSEWLRVAQGELSSRERRLLTQHLLSGIPVRLFPKKIDWQFAHLLAQHLVGRNLTSFRAKYSLKPQGLFIDNIKVNGKLIKGSWHLVAQQC